MDKSDNSTSTESNNKEAIKRKHEHENEKIVNKSASPILKYKARKVCCVRDWPEGCGPSAPRPQLGQIPTVVTSENPWLSDFNEDSDSEGLSPTLATTNLEVDEVGESDNEGNSKGTNSLATTPPSPLPSSPPLSPPPLSSSSSTGSQRQTT